MEAVTLRELDNYDPRPVRRGTRSRYLCPLSGVCRDKTRDNSHRSLSVDTVSGVFYCHRCGEKGKLREFWEERVSVKSMPKRTQLRPVAALVSRAVIKAVEPKHGKKTDLTLLREKMSIYAEAFTNSTGEKYLAGRGIPAEVSRNTGCGFAQAWEHWEKKNDDWHLTGTDERVVFPVCDESGELIAMHSRAIRAEHFHSSKITKGNKSSGVFYSSPGVFDSPIVAICEGPVDALALQTCGIPAVAMIGTTVPNWLARQLRGKAVLIATDADKAGDEAAAKLAITLRGFASDLYRLRPRHGKDWGEELEHFGAELKRESLSPFAPETDNASRTNSAWQFLHDGDLAAAEFAARRINDIELRNALLVLIRKEHRLAA